ncbi:glycosyltransferase family 2 protein [Frondihabitans cladoniiphilus]|uniref:Dolichol-phosphate mannosyltransferase n=1 Tax=Frondihabitans cladoniiphilus TaxID=715785 RepID=A0ABP8W7U7_9MICO
MELTVVIPTFNEAPNVEELVRRIEAATQGVDAEILFVDDSKDDTPDVIRATATKHEIPVRLIHRETPVGGLSGAVIEGLTAGLGDISVVMDGDLQHRPETIPSMLEAARATGADIVVASRRVEGGSSDGLSNGLRRAVSKGSIKLTKALFPGKLNGTTDPMSGFFAVRRDTVDLSDLRPRGFKILLEILARKQHEVVEVPLVFEARQAGTSKADMKQGFALLRQLFDLRISKISGFAAIGAFGAVANLVILAVLTHWVGMANLPAAVIAGAVTILSNFLLQEKFVFHDRMAGGRSTWMRFVHSAGFNVVETAIRTAVLWLVTKDTDFNVVYVQAALLVVGFGLRFAYHSIVVYKQIDTETEETGTAVPVSTATAFEAVEAERAGIAAEKLPVA